MIDFSLAPKEDQSRKPRGILRMPDQDSRELQICDCETHIPGECRICSYDSHDPFPDRTTEHMRSIDFINRLFESLDNIGDRKELEAEYLCLLPQTLWCFVFRSRRWRQLDVARLDPADQGNDGFDGLVLPKGYKKLVKALVKNHFQMSQNGSSNDVSSNDVHDYDLVKGKGW